MGGSGRGGRERAGEARRAAGGRGGERRGAGGRSAGGAGGRAPEHEGRWDGGRCTGLGSVVQRVARGGAGPTGGLVRGPVDGLAGEWRAAAGRRGRGSERGRTGEAGGAAGAESRRAGASGGRACVERARRGIERRAGETSGGRRKVRGGGSSGPGSWWRTGARDGAEIGGVRSEAAARRERPGRGGEGNGEGERGGAACGRGRPGLLHAYSTPTPRLLHAYGVAAPPHRTGEGRGGGGRGGGLARGRV
jgi:hypothetical protein